MVTTSKRAAASNRAAGAGRKQMLLHLDCEVIKGLKKAAVDLDTTASALVEKLLVAWLKRHETKRTAAKERAVGDAE